MRTHPLIGDQLLEPLDLLAGARPIVRHHHERWDGAGYPDGLAGEAIPVGARIVAVADAVEAMSATAYRKALERRPRSSPSSQRHRRAVGPGGRRHRATADRGGELVLAQGGLRLLELTP